MSLVNIKIEGQSYQVDSDLTILEAARKYFDHGMKEQCLANLDQFLAKNEYNFDANLMKLLVEHNCKRLETLVNKIATKVAGTIPEPPKINVTYWGKPDNATLLDPKP